MLVLMALLSLSIAMASNAGEPTSLSNNSQSTDYTQTASNHDAAIQDRPEHKDDTTGKDPGSQVDTPRDETKSVEADRGFDPCLINNKLPVCIKDEDPNDV